jgi:hypothetical protein
VLVANLNSVIDRQHAIDEHFSRALGAPPTFGVSTRFLHSP